MRPLYFFLCSILLSSHLIAQPNAGQWTWVGGDSISLNLELMGRFGTSGNFSQSNFPTARQGCVSWTDLQGRCWLFAGNGFDSLGNRGLLNDLWCYDPQKKEWAWIKGSNRINSSGGYGTRGVPSMNNLPGSREYAVGWLDKEGNLWLMGGRGIDKNGLSGILNDLWKFDLNSGNWVWISGSSGINPGGVYGTRTVASPSNVPGNRVGSIGWTDSDGNLWLFGGSNTCCRLNDLWKFDPISSIWTWMHGSNSVNATASYGVMGSASATNTPGARSTAVGVSDQYGNFWLFGGFGYGTDINAQGYLNDLWFYNRSLNQWSWESGSNTLNSSGTYGTKGISTPTNNPGARSVSTAWKDQSGRFVLFGGSNNFGSFNDLWSYDPVTRLWVWIKGDNTVNRRGRYPPKQTSTDWAAPGSRHSVAGWSLPDGSFRTLGGQTLDSVFNPGVLNDFWVYKSIDNQWFFENGAASIQRSYGNYTIKDTTDPRVVPGARKGGTSIQSSDGKIWLMGGEGLAKNRVFGILNDLWLFDPVNTQWTWISGSDTINQNGSYGIRGRTAVANIPRARSYACSWSDTSGAIWIFGGSSPAGYLNDLWKFTPSTRQWIWMGGSSSGNANGVYGIRGVPSATSVPGARNAAACWKDSAGNLWLFGGYGRSSTGQVGYLNDLWKYDLGLQQWTWVSGSPIVNQSGFYDQINVVGSGTPGSRQGAVNVTDSLGMFYLWGGYGYDALGALGFLNDLWHFDPLKGKWTWVNGPDQINQKGVYGVKGMPNDLNLPGARQWAAGWLDRLGSLVLFGGNGYANTPNQSGDLADLWSYDFKMNQWVWIAGADAVNPSSFYGEKNSSGFDRHPSPRGSMLQGLDTSGNLWVMGGSGNYRRSNTTAFYNDLWKYTRPCVVQPDFTLSKSSLCLNENLFHVVNKTKSSVAQPQLQWDFGDGRTSNQIQPQFSYQNPGTYTVKLIVSAGNCKDSISKNVEVLPMPTSAIQYEGTPVFCDRSFKLLQVAQPKTEYRYQWLKEGVPIELATNSQYDIREAGSYSLLVTDNTSLCSITSEPVTFAIQSLPQAPVGKSLQEFCNEATVLQLKADGTEIRWYNKLTDGAILTSSNFLEDGNIYYASQTSDGCESNDRLAVEVKINKPPIPSGPTVQKYCYDGTIADLEVTGSTIKWYTVASGGEPLASNLPLSDAAVYYASQTEAGCESASRFSVAVTLLKPSEPTGDGQQSFCGSALIEELVVNGNAIKWYNLQSGGVELLIDQSAENGFVYYASQTIEGCESRDRFPVTVTIKSIPPMPTGNSRQELCSGSQLASITVTGSQLQWYATATNGTSLDGATLAENGKTYYVTQTVNGCESVDRLRVQVSFITAIDRPVIRVKGLDLVSSASLGNQWLLNGKEIPGAKSPTYRPVETGTYTVQITPNACGALVSDPVLFSVTGGEFVRIGPNPAAQTLRVFWMLEKDVNLHMRIISEQGQVLRNYGLLASGAALDVAALQPGRYYLQLVSGDGKCSYVLGFVRGK